LNLVGIAGKATAESNPVQKFIDSTSDGTILGSSDLPGTFTAKYSQPLAGIKRTSINLMLKDSLLNQNVEIREGWELLDIKEEEDSVTAYFNGGRSATGSFLIGCDGIKSASRRALLQAKGTTEGPPSFTGLTQVSRLVDGFSFTANLWFQDGWNLQSTRSSAKFRGHAQLVRRRNSHDRVPGFRNPNIMGNHAAGG
jgi:2-polyprenyl-6-methoxyphenol hydroxylase-like FAD-dependent oxidoreductase